MSMTIGFAAALGLQLAAQGFGGLWGAAIAGVATGVLLRERGAFRVGFVAAAIAAALLLAWVAARGGDVLGFSAMIGGNFSVPSWGIFAATLLLPALQAGGLAGGVARLLRR